MTFIHVTIFTFVSLLFVGCSTSEVTPRGISCASNDQETEACPIPGREKQSPLRERR